MKFIAESMDIRLRANILNIEVKTASKSLVCDEISFESDRTPMPGDRCD